VDISGYPWISSISIHIQSIYITVTSDSESSDINSDREDVPGTIHLSEEAVVAEEKDGSKSAGPEQPPDLNSRDEESIESPDQMREPTSDSDKLESSKAYFDCASGKSCENHRLERQHIVESFSVVNRDRRIPACYCR
jgi:hypothetical protein